MGKAMRIIKTLWLAWIMTGMVETGTPNEDEIFRVQHASPLDYLGAWGAGFTIPPKETFFQDGSNRPVLEVLTPKWEIYSVAAQKPPVIYLRDRLDPSDVPHSWGHFPSGDAFSNPLASHGRIWLFARNQGRWILYQANLNHPTPQWISSGEGPGGIVQFFLNENSDPVVVYMDRIRRWYYREGQFTGGGQSLFWGPEVKLTRLEAQELLKTARDSITRRGVTGEFDIGRDGVFLSFSCHVPIEARFRYRSSPGIDQPYGPWSPPQSQETVPLSRRGRFFQYQVVSTGEIEPVLPVFPHISLSYTTARDSPPRRSPSMTRAEGSQEGILADDGGFTKNLASVVERMAFGDSLSESAPPLESSLLESLENPPADSWPNPSFNPSTSTGRNAQESKADATNGRNPRRTTALDQSKTGIAGSSSGTKSDSRTDSPSGRSQLMQPKAADSTLPPDNPPSITSADSEKKQAQSQDPRSAPLVESNSRDQEDSEGEDSERHDQSQAPQSLDESPPAESISETPGDPSPKKGQSGPQTDRSPNLKSTDSAKAGSKDSTISNDSSHSFDPASEKTDEAEIEKEKLPRDQVAGPSSSTEKDKDGTAAPGLTFNYEIGLLEKPEGSKTAADTPLSLQPRDQPDSSGIDKQDPSSAASSPDGDYSGPIGENLGGPPGPQSGSSPEPSKDEETLPAHPSQSWEPASAQTLEFPPPPGWLGGTGNVSSRSPLTIAASAGVEAPPAGQYVLDFESLADSVRKHPGWWGLAVLAILSPFIHRTIRRWIASRTVEGAIARFPPVLSARERTEAWIQRISENAAGWNYVIRFQPWVTAADLTDESLIVMNEEGKIASVSLDTFAVTGRALDPSILFKTLASISKPLWNVRFAQAGDDLLLVGRDAHGRIKGMRFQVPSFDKGRRVPAPRSLHRVLRIFTWGKRDWAVGESLEERQLLTRKRNGWWPSRWREERPAELRHGAILTLSSGYEPILAGKLPEDPGHLWLFRKELEGNKNSDWKAVAKTDSNGQECLMHVTPRRGFLVETTEKSRRLRVHLFARDAKGGFNVRVSNTVPVPCTARYFALSMAQDFLFVLGREDSPSNGSLSGFVLLVAYLGDLLRIPAKAED